ncbi:Calcineurin B-like protein 4 [Hondaea fermentalgiana]|uniref:Calcineurin B-like protein 4 n=1 Tax=Hondaea fermentalgiana TaxID=2315210 RepID=A0A2R5GCB9_9STRA|nr:Calcineurin B-like protein 4 [Hondaea fermentalgiana]|eukprot:GBG27979.1 Calcineurin B-like protein 4 [Hondaea fermentalgiana]
MIWSMEYTVSAKTEYMRDNAQEAEESAAGIEKRLRALVSKSRILALQENNCEMLDKDQLRKFFDENGVRFEPIIFERLYQMMDVDKQGFISVSKLALTFAILIQSGSVAKDNVELAFRLFDSNQDGSIDQHEFQEMVIALVGKRVSHLYEIPAGMTYFREFVKKKQVNVSDQVREACREQVEQASTKELKTLASNASFEAAQYEAVKMIEQGPLLRFKSRLRSDTNCFPLGESVWDHLELQHSEQMTLEQFRMWASLAPDLFNFLDELQKLIKATDEKLSNEVISIQED